MLGMVAIGFILIAIFMLLYYTTKDTRRKRNILYLIIITFICTVGYFGLYFLNPDAVGLKEYFSK